MHRLMNNQADEALLESIRSRLAEMYTDCELRSDVSAMDICTGNQPSVETSLDTELVSEIKTEVTPSAFLEQAQDRIENVECEDASDLSRLLHNSAYLQSVALMTQSNEKS